MRVLITGAGGQLGLELQRAFAGHELLALTHAGLDIADAGAVDDAVASFRPDLVLNAAALTDTTRCEREPELALAVNGAGAGHVARAAARAGAAIVHVSTNEVFDGTKGAPYVESDEPHPVNAYGRSKLAGERAVAAATPDRYIVRTSWLYGDGGRHFVAKVLAAAASGSLTGLTDEIATPTWTRDLAGAIARLVATGQPGVYHLPNAGRASRYEWVETIVELAGLRDVSLRAVTAEAFRRSLPADAVAPPKPPDSTLANVAAAALGIELRPWREALRAFFAEGPGG